MKSTKLLNFMASDNKIYYIDLTTVLYIGTNYEYNKYFECTKYIAELHFSDNSIIKYSSRDENDIINIVNEFKNLHNEA